MRLQWAIAFVISVAAAVINMIDYKLGHNTLFLFASGACSTLAFMDLLYFWRS